MTIQELQNAIGVAQPGSTIEYWAGVLARDAVTDFYAQQVRHLMQDLARHGVVALTQRRLGPGHYRYLATICEGRADNWWRPELSCVEAAKTQSDYRKRRGKKAA